MSININVRIEGGGCVVPLYPDDTVKDFSCRVMDEANCDERRCVIYYEGDQLNGEALKGMTDLEEISIGLYEEVVEKVGSCFKMTRVEPQENPPTVTIETDVGNKRLRLTADNRNGGLVFEHFSQNSVPSRNQKFVILRTDPTKPNLISIAHCDYPVFIGQRAGFAINVVLSLVGTPTKFIRTEIAKSTYTLDLFDHTDFVCQCVESKIAVISKALHAKEGPIVSLPPKKSFAIRNGLCVSGDEAALIDIPQVGNSYPDLIQSGSSIISFQTESGGFLSVSHGFQLLVAYDVQYLPISRLHASFHKVCVSPGVFLLVPASFPSFFVAMRRHDCHLIIRAADRRNCYFNIITTPEGNDIISLKGEPEMSWAINHSKRFAFVRNSDCPRQSSVKSAASAKCCSFQ